MGVIFLSETAAGTSIISDQAYHLSKGRIWIRGEINEELAGNVASQILWCDDKGLPVTIYIDSVGGDVVAGLSIIDQLESAKTPIEIVFYGSSHFSLWCSRRSQTYPASRQGHAPPAIYRWRGWYGK